MSSRRAAYVQIFATAALFSTGGAAIKASSLNGWQIAASRSGIAALVLLVLLPEARRRWRLETLAVGAAYAATLILFVHANRLTTAASTIFLQATSPLYVVLFGPLLLREPLRRRDLAFLVVAATGLLFFFVGVEPPAETAPDPLLGNVLAALSGLTYALTLVGLRAGGRRQDGGDASSAVVCGNVLACLVAGAAALPVPTPQPVDLVVVTYLGVFQVALAYVLLTRGLRRVTALEGSILLLLEPTLSPVWAWLLHGERPGPWALVGGSLILGGTVVKVWLEVRSGRPAAARDGRPPPKG